MHRLFLNTKRLLTMKNLIRKKRNFSTINRKKIDEFLLNVAHGKQAEANFMLKANPTLAWQRGDVTDYSNRTFNNITGFQYATWALDWHMYNMILESLSLDEANKQFIEFKNNNQHGHHYNFHDLLDPIKLYLSKLDVWTCEQLGTHWCKVIGQAYARVPAHVGNQLCHPHRSFLPIPNYSELILPRSFKIINNIYFYPVMHYSIGTMGVDFSPFRWHDKTVGIGTMKPCPNARVSAQTDLNALIRLHEVSLEKRDELNHKLGFIFYNHTRKY